MIAEIERHLLATAVPSFGWCSVVAPVIIRYNSSSSRNMNDLTRALPADAHTTAREQIEQILEERMAALTAGVEEAVAETLLSMRRELADKLNQSVRRLRAFETTEEWGKTLVEATQGFCDRAALFTLGGATLHAEAARNVAGDLTVNVPLDSAPAFASAVESRDTVVAMRTSGEMSKTLASWLGADGARKFHVFPIAARERVTALLYADAGDREVESGALELLTTVAGAVIESRPSAELVNIEDLAQKPPVASWFSLSQEEQDLHLRAQRFARVQVAEIRLYKSEEVKKGRIAGDLYASLRVDIDSARDVFRRDFLSAAPTMVDYLHYELVRTLANNDAELLGPHYPGPLV